MCGLLHARGPRRAAARDKRLADPSLGTGRSAAAHCWSPHGHALLNWLPTLGSRLWRCGQAARDELTHYWHITLVRQLIRRRKAWLVGVAVQSSSKNLRSVDGGQDLLPPRAEPAVVTAVAGANTRNQQVGSLSKTPQQSAIHTGSSGLSCPFQRRKRPGNVRVTAHGIHAAQLP